MSLGLAECSGNPNISGLQLSQQPTAEDSFLSSASSVFQEEGTVDPTQPLPGRELAALPQPEPGPGREKLSSSPLRPRWAAQGLSLGSHKAFPTGHSTSHRPPKWQEQECPAHQETGRQQPRGPCPAVRPGALGSNPAEERAGRGLGEGFPLDHTECSTGLDAITLVTACPCSAGSGPGVENAPRHPVRRAGQGNSCSRMRFLPVHQAPGAPQPVDFLSKGQGGAQAWLPRQASQELARSHPGGPGAGQGRAVGR